MTCCTASVYGPSPRCRVGQCAGGLPGHGDPPLDLLPLEAPAGPARPRGPAATRTQGAVDGQPDQRPGRAARGRLRSGASRVRPSPDRRRARQTKVGEISLSANGVWRVLRRHGLSTRAKRYGLVAGYAAPPEPQRPQPPPERHRHVDHPGELVQLDCCCIGRLSGTKGTVWQDTAIDVARPPPGPPCR